MKCKQHPRYVATRIPMKTMLYPDGCPTCLGIWEKAKTDERRLVKTVNVELSIDEARVAVVALDALIANGGVASTNFGAPLRQLYVLLIRAMKESI